MIKTILYATIINIITTLNKVNCSRKDNNMQTHYITSRVAGISFQAKNITKLPLEQDLTCCLVPEPTNEYDPNAILVKAKNPKTGRYLKIGYLPKGNPKHLLLDKKTETLVRISQINDTINDVQFYSAKVYQKEQNNNHIVAQSELYTLRYNEYKTDLQYLEKQLNKILSDTYSNTPTFIKSTQIEYEQGTEEWLRSRENKITGTTVYDYLNNKTIKKHSNSTNNFQNIYTEHGHIFERVIHRQIEEILCEHDEFIYMPSPNSYTFGNLLASPDGLLAYISDNNTTKRLSVEIKNFQPAGFMQLQDLSSTRYKKVYYQLQLNMFLTNSNAGVLIAYCPMNPKDHYFIHTITPDKELYKQFSNECK